MFYYFSSISSKSIYANSYSRFNLMNSLSTLLKLDTFESFLKYPSFY